MHKRQDYKSTVSRFKVTRYTKFLFQWPTHKTCKLEKGSVYVLILVAIANTSSSMLIFKANFKLHQGNKQGHCLLRCKIKWKQKGEQCKCAMLRETMDGGTHNFLFPSVHVWCPSQWVTMGRSPATHWQHALETLCVNKGIHLIGTAPHMGTVLVLTFRHA